LETAVIKLKKVEVASNNIQRCEHAKWLKKKKTQKAQ